MAPSLLLFKAMTPIISFYLVNTWQVPGMSNETWIIPSPSSIASHCLWVYKILQDLTSFSTFPSSSSSKSTSATLIFSLLLWICKIIYSRPLHLLFPMHEKYSLWYIWFIYNLYPHSYILWSFFKLAPLIIIHSLIFPILKNIVHSTTWDYLIYWVIFSYYLKKMYVVLKISFMNSKVFSLGHCSFHKTTYNTCHTVCVQ